MNEALARHPVRCELTRKEGVSLILHFATSKGRAAQRKPPNAFTEYRALITANILRKTAIRAIIQAVKWSMKPTPSLTSNSELAHKLAVLEQKHEAQVKGLVDLPKVRYGGRTPL